MRTLLKVAKSEPKTYDQTPGPVKAKPAISMEKEPGLSSSNMTTSSSTSDNIKTNVIKPPDRQFKVDVPQQPSPSSGQSSPSKALGDIIKNIQKRKRQGSKAAKRNTISPNL